jgi:transposase
VIAFVAEKLYAKAERITLVQDNLSAHRKAALYEVFEAERARSILNRIEFVYTPKHGSWLNMAEIELSVLNRVALKERIKSKQQLQTQINIYLKEKIKRLYKSTGSSPPKTPEQNLKSYTESLTLKNTSNFFFFIFEAINL